MNRKRETSLPLRIQFVSFDEVPSFKGATTHILGGLRQVVRHAKVELISLGKNPIPCFGNLLHRPISISEPNVLRRGRLFRARVASILRKRPADVIHFRSPWEGIPAVRCGVPTIFEVNGLPSVEMPYHYRTTDNALRIFRDWEEECLEKATVLLFPSRQIANFVQRNFDKNLEAKSIILSNGYDLLPLHSEREKARETDSPLRIVYLGTLSYWQGVEWALRGLRGFAGNWSLDMFAPPHRLHSKRIERRIQRWNLKEKVRVLEPISRGELYQFLPKYDIGIAPFVRTFRNSEQGCCPIKLLDYLSHGLPVLASRLEITEPFLQEAVNGYFFEANSHISFRTRLAEILSDPPDRTKVSVRARDSLQGIPSWDEYSMKLLELYQSLSACR